MAAPKQKYFGNISLDGVKKAVTSIPSKVADYKGDKQLKVSAAMWDDGGISIEVWSQETGSVKIGNLRVSSFDNSPGDQVSADLAPKDDDLPF